MKCKVTIVHYGGGKKTGLDAGQPGYRRSRPMTGQQVMARIRERDDGEILSLIKRLAKAHHVTVDELLGGDRRRGPMDARAALWEAMEATGHWSSERLGELFGRPGSSVRWATKRRRKRLANQQVVGKAWQSCVQPIEQPLPTKEVA